ncbi:MAG: flagellin [Tepidisphaeraceae bacterium]|jgi:flagellin
MSVINTNVSSLIAQRSLAQNNTALNTSLERLSTGLQINSGADNPAGLIAGLSLQQEQTGIQTAISNASLAGNVIGTAEGGLNEVSSLLIQLQGLIGQAANSGALSSDEVAANQLQVDSILSTINRISQSTSFEGSQLLNGSLAYTTSSVGSAVTNLQINSALVPDGGNVAVAVQVVSSAKTAALTYQGGAISGNTVTLQIAGNLGSTQLSFASGTSVSSIATAVNGVKNSTGLSAQVSGTALRVNSTQYGSAQFASIQVIAGKLAQSFSATKTVGADAGVTINGATAEANGLAISYRNASLDVSLDLATNYDKPTSTTFYVTGGGATFQLGSEVDATNKASIGVSSVSTGDLGDSFNGYLSSIGSGGSNSLSSNNLSTAQNILNSAIGQVSSLRGRLGAFQTFTIGSTVSSLGVSYENVSAAESAIMNTDFASETSNLTRDQILSQAATTVLAQANAQPDNVLKLLGGT